MTAITVVGIGAVALLGLSAIAQTSSSQPGQGWMPEFNHASSQLVSLAEATPAEKFSWRPGPGVRSMSEVYMHIALTNYFLLRQAGAAVPAEATAKGEKSVTAKADVIRVLKASQDLVRASYPKADRQKKARLFGADTTVDAIFLRLLVHNHEHMGQSVAYARMNGIVPPWSKGGAQ